MSKHVKERAEELYTVLEKLLRDICFSIRIHGREALKNYSITHAQFELLQRIYFNGPQTMTKLSQMLGIAKSTTTGLVMRLERDGFLKRKQSREDKRVAVVEITLLGEEVIKAVINSRVDYVKKLCEKFSDEDLNQLYSSLENLSNLIKETSK
ncbi:MAG: MarR family transcriptional regulator [Fervidobacterium sp.]